jgi:hypothetical protein
MHTQKMARPLFGGAMSAAVPRTLLDVSRMRQVPDNQEAFVSRPSDDGVAATPSRPPPTPLSLVIELLQRVDAGMAAEGEPLAVHLLADLADANDATGGAELVGGVHRLQPAHAPLLTSPGATGWRFEGRMRASKARSATQGLRQDAAGASGCVEEVVALLAGLLRLPAPHDTDVLVVVNAPLGASGDVGGGGGTGAAGTHRAAPVDAVALLDGVLASLAVHDWGLFGAG